MVRIYMKNQPRPELSEEEKEQKEYLDKKREANMKKMKISEEELDAQGFPIYLRDGCVRWSIKLEKCRLANYYLPWACEEELGRFERCEYKEYLRQVRRSESMWKKQEKLKLVMEKIEKKKAKESS